MRSKLEIIFISISFIFTTFLFIIIGSLFVIPSPQGFVESLFSNEMMSALKITLSTSILAAFFVMLVAVPTAYSLSRYQFPLKSLVKSILDLPMAFPEIVLGIALLMILGDQFLGNFLESIGINIVFTTAGIIIAQFFVALPYAVRILYSTFNYVNPRFEFVSRSLGYGEFETFKNITLPLAKGGIFASSVVTLARCIGTFAAVLLVGGGTYLKTETLPIAIYYNLSLGNIDNAITAAILLVLISFVAIFVLEKYAYQNIEGMG
ncbi:MAG: ABC transporter permease [Methanobacterium sp.]|uniref:ABC transporter permease n=1 Tax=Methanobacterium sp. TaxID=2164 RepID=UPI00338ED42E|nr:ABC transporter permease [Methanobacterium sp.]